MNQNQNDTVILELDRPRELRLGHKALKKFSAMTGCTMERMEDALKDYGKMTSLIYVMLSQEDSTLTPKQTDDLLDRVPLHVIVKKCSQAIAAAFTDPDSAEAAKEENDPPTAAGTGGTASAWPPPSDSPFANGST